MRHRLAFLLILFCVLFGCGKTSPSPSQQSSAPPAPALPSIVAFGDSLTAGLGLATQETYPAQLQEILKAQGYSYEVINAGVSGDTSSGGLRRIEWSLQDNPKVLILELGANDMLRGQPIDLTRQNLAAIIEKAQSKKVSVVLAGNGSADQRLVLITVSRFTICTAIWPANTTFRSSPSFFRA